MEEITIINESLHPEAEQSTPKNKEGDEINFIEKTAIVRKETNEKIHKELKKEKEDKKEVVADGKP